VQILSPRPGGQRCEWSGADHTVVGIDVGTIKFGDEEHRYAERATGFEPAAPCSSPVRAIDFLPSIQQGAAADMSYLQMRRLEPGRYVQQEIYDKDNQ